MNYQERLQNVSILGAGGKMGSGITLLLAIEVHRIQKLYKGNKPVFFHVNAIDPSEMGLEGLRVYLKKQLLKIAEKQCVYLRKVYEERKDLIENGDIINAYVEEVIANVRFSTRIEYAYDSYCIFEAIHENIDLKKKLFSDIFKHSKLTPWFFTNTSSIPIIEIDKCSGLDGNLLGLHFYNPPLVQKLVEVIPSENTQKDIFRFAEVLCKHLRKQIVISKDIAGFIGNGHFMQEVLFSLKKVEELSRQMSVQQALWTMDTVVRDYLMRPMGIFQLIDYVGVDVVCNIMNVMNKRLKGLEFDYSFLTSALDNKVLGGQNNDGSQKDGLFKYEKGVISAVFNFKTKLYEELGSKFLPWQEALGEMPEDLIMWKKLIRLSNKENYLKEIFQGFQNRKDLGSLLAMEYAKESKRIALSLVDCGVAKSKEDVNTVMCLGFFHAYGPINQFF
ncbi:MAG: 3-hydroxyacyl-CoA dehydrogenase family protein [Bacteroidales bacterium]